MVKSEAELPESVQWRLFLIAFGMLQITLGAGLIVGACLRAWVIVLSLLSRLDVLTLFVPFQDGPELPVPCSSIRRKTEAPV